MKAQFLTDRGLVRPLNEDSGGIYYNKAGQLLAVIADGMGGHRAGDKASEMAVSIIQENWNKLDEIASEEQAEKWLEDTLQTVNTTIYKQSQKDEKYLGMGTTIVITICTEDFITVAHIGDSRCYIYTEEGFRQITEDHSLVNELIRSGQITVEEAEHHPRKNIVLKALGTERFVEADIQSLNWNLKNKLLLCSDGLSDKVSNDELCNILKTPDELNKIAQSLVDLANERGGEDNISLVIISYYRTAKVGEEDC